MKMKFSFFLFFTVAILFLCSSNSLAFPNGWIDTDRFGYEGTITKYSDSDLTNEVDTIAVTERDLSLSVDAENPSAIVMGSWWYSTAVDEDGSPRGPGWGNTHGNTGPGYMQYYESDSQDYVTNQNYRFSDFDGTHWQTFKFSLSVENAPYYDENGEAAAYSRLSAPENTDDWGIFRSLNVNLTASGLEGTRQGGWIVAEESEQFPTNLTGSITGTFENLTDSNSGFYTFDFNLNLDNWAYDNRADLVGEYDTFREGSYGAPVPEPTTWLLFGTGLLGLACLCRRNFVRKHS
jgi:hypothetical protein